MLIIFPSMVKHSPVFYTDRATWGAIEVLVELGAIVGLSRLRAPCLAENRGRAWLFKKAPPHRRRDYSISTCSCRQTAYARTESKANTRIPFAPAKCISRDIICTRIGARERGLQKGEDRRQALGLLLPKNYPFLLSGGGTS